MQEEAFVSAVERRADVASDETRAATTATLRTLGERITRGEAESASNGGNGTGWTRRR